MLVCCYTLVQVRADTLSSSEKELYNYKAVIFNVMATIFIRLYFIACMSKWVNLVCWYDVLLGGAR